MKIKDLFNKDDLSQILQVNQLPEDVVNAGIENMLKDRLVYKQVRVLRNTGFMVSVGDSTHKPSVEVSIHNATLDIYLLSTSNTICKITLKDNKINFIEIESYDDTEEVDTLTFTLTDKNNIVYTIKLEDLNLTDRIFRYITAYMISTNKGGN